MSTIELNAEQQSATLRGIFAANAVYDLNNAAQRGVPSAIQVGQALTAVTDMIGQAGYNALPIAVPGDYVTTKILDGSSGLNAFVATGSNTALVAIAGLNGVLGSGFGSAADTVEATKFMAGQFKDFVLDGGLAALREQSLSDPTNFKLELSGQSGGAAVVDAIVMAIQFGVPESLLAAWNGDPRLTELSLVDRQNLFSGLEGFKMANLTATKINGYGSEFLLGNLGYATSEIEAVNQSSATITSIRMDDTATRYADIVTFLGGKTLGKTCAIDTTFDTAVGSEPGSYLGWFHRLEGALGKALTESSGNLNGICRIVEQNPLPMETTAALLKLFDELRFNDNKAAYGGLAAMGLFTTAFSAPGETAQVFGKLANALTEGALGDGFGTIVGGLIEGLVKTAALSNPAGFLIRVGALLFGSKLLSSAVGDNYEATAAWAATLPGISEGGSRQPFTNAAGVGSMVVDTYPDRTIYFRQDGLVVTVFENGNYRADYGPTGPNGARRGFELGASGGGIVFVELPSGELISRSFSNDEVPVPNDEGGMDIVKATDSGSQSVFSLHADGRWTQSDFDAAHHLDSEERGLAVFGEALEGDWASVKAIYTDDEITSLQRVSSDGTTEQFQLESLTTVERQSYGFFTQQEVGSRLGQLGLIDANQFMQNGFAATGEQNAGLNDLQVEIGGVKFVWNNNWADLNLTRGAGWSAVGNGALDASGAPYTLAQLVTQSIFYIGGAENHLSPLALDLDGDGVATDLTHAYDGGRVFFDIDADGFAERVGWVKADDGLLATDHNGNGRIDDITELYGDDQMPAFQKLRLLDVNGDSRIDVADAAYADLRVWQDANQDGITQEGELKTLASLDIQSISTNDHNDTRWAQENYISSSTTYTRLENGVAVDREIADVHFLNDNANTWQLGAHSQVYGSDIQIDLEAILLPLSRGYGTLPSLHLAMSANPELKRMVRELAYLPLERLGEAAGRVGEILLEWAGVRGKDPASHATGDGPRIDGRKVDFVELFTGLTWAQRGVTSMVGEDASIGIKKTWNGIEAAMLQRMLAQGALHAVMPNASYDFATDKIILNESLSAILARASTLAPTTTDAAREFWTQLGGILIGGKEELGTTVAAINTAVSDAAGQPLYLGEHMVAPSNFGDPDWGLYTGNGTANEELVGMIFQGDAQANTLGGTGAGEYFFGGAGNDSVIAGAGDDYLRGDDGDDMLDGGAGEDALRGGTGNDLLLGGAGNDMLEGFEGNDSIYGGDGYDMIAGGAGADVLDGGAGRDVVLLRQSTAGGYVNLASGRAHGSESEGDVISNFEDIRGSGYADVLIGDAANNSLNGEGGDDVLIGGGGNDSLFAATGHQRYFGGAGDDWLWGYDGGDHMDGGAGFDYVAYSHPFAANGVVVELSLGRGTGGVATGDSYTGIEGVWGVRGGDDVLIGDAGDNVLFGNDGNDILIGGAGNDRLQFSSGTQHLFGQGGSDRFEAPTEWLQSYVDGVYVDGSDAGDPYAIAPEQAVFIHDFDVNDPSEKIVLQGLAMSAVLLRQRGDDTAIELTDGRVLYVLGVMPDLLTSAHFTLPAGVADVTVGPPLGQTGQVLAGSDADNKLVGSVGDDALTAHGGRDALSGGQGNDTLYGGADDDLLIGGMGADSLDGGSGFDTARYDDSWAGVTIDLTNGAGLGGTAQGDMLQGIERIVGSNRDDNLLGSDSVGTEPTLWETLEGQNGNDVLNGRDGRNRLIGGGGTDRFVIEAHGASGGTAFTEIADFDMNDPDEKIDLSAIDFSGKRLVAEWSADRTKLKFFTGSGIAGVDTLYEDALTLTNLKPWDENGSLPKLPSLASKFVFAEGGAPIGFEVRSESSSSSSWPVTGGSIGADSFRGPYSWITPFSGDDSIDLSISAPMAGILVTHNPGQTLRIANFQSYAYQAYVYNYQQFSWVNFVNESHSNVEFDFTNLAGIRSYQDIQVSTVTAGPDAGTHLDLGDGQKIILLGWSANQSSQNQAGNYFYIWDYSINITYSFFNTGSLNGGFGYDQLVGGKYADRMVGNGGADLLEGRGGNDTLTGGDGADRFVIGRDAGTNDVITDLQYWEYGDQIDLSEFTEIQSFADLKQRMIQQGNDTILSLGSNQLLTLQGIQAGNLRRVSFVGAAGANSAPELLGAPIAAWTEITGGMVFELEVDRAKLLDADGDDLMLSIATMDGQPLPGWVHFDGSTGRISGTAPNGGDQTLHLVLRASDGQVELQSEFVLNLTIGAGVSGSLIQNQTLTAPELLGASGVAGSVQFQWQALNGSQSWIALGGETNEQLSLTEAHVGQVLRVVASYIDGDGQTQSRASLATLPIANVNDLPLGGLTLLGNPVQNETLWVANSLTDLDGLGTLNYQWQESADGTSWTDIAGANFVGFTLSEQQVGKYLRVIASYEDGHGASETVVSGSSENVANVNDSPLMASSISAQTAIEDQLFEFTVAPGSFTDPDNGDVLVYSAELASGAPLPGWLSFDPMSRRFSGTPLNDNVGSLAIRTYATDSAGAWASQVFDLVVGNTNDAPEAVVPIPHQWAAGENFFSLTVPQEAFVDVDIGDTLTISASLANGAPLPVWLSFDPSTLTFSGTPALEDVGKLSLVVRATDLAEAACVIPFDIDVFVGVVGSAGAEVLTGGESADVIRGLAGDDSLYGYGGGDLLIGGSGVDYVVGGAGDDIYHYESGDGSDWILDDDGADQLNFGLGLSEANVQAWRDTSNLYLSVVGTTDVITVQGWFDLTTNRVESVQFDDGTIWNTATLAAAPFFGTAGADYLYGTTGNDKLYGFDGTDTLTGDAGNDTLEGGTGNDQLDGGAGNDSFVFNLGFGQDNVADASGTDIIKLGAGLSAANVQAWRDTSNLYLSVVGTTDVITVQGWFDLTTNRVESVQFDDGTIWNTATLAAAPFFGTAGADYLYGTTGNDKLYGFDGTDTLTGDAGNDTLEGGTGNDQLDGGAGNDSFVFNLGFGQDNVADASGTDIIKLGAGLSAANVQAWRDTSNLYLSVVGTTDVITVQGWFDLTTNRVESVQFDDGTIWNTATLAAAPFFGTAGADYLYGTTGNDKLYGFDGTDTLTADAGNDTLEGGTGNDQLDGGAGNDSFVFNLGFGQDNVADASGTDIIKLGAGLSAANVQAWRDTSNLYLSVVGTTDVITVQGWFDLTTNRVESVQFDDGTIWNTATLAAAPFFGTAGADYLSGTIGNDKLYGFDGPDTLTGDAGNDTLEGGTGNDSLYGGDGNDTYLFGLGGGKDIISETTGTTDIVRLGAGISTSDIRVSRDTSNLYLTIRGTNEGISVQSWFSGSGYKVEQLVFDDTTVWTAATLESKTTVVTEGDDFVWGTTGADSISGLGGDDELVGNEGNDTLTGGVGNDTLNGGSGIDLLVGGIGDDSYVIDSASDVITELAGEGMDTVRSNLTYTLGSNLESLVLVEAGGAINGTGNSLDNTIWGNSAANTLNGGVGADTLIGGAGNDIYVVDNLGDSLVENAGEGTDTAQSSISFGLVANIENLMLTGTSAINGTGNDLNNSLVGNAAANTLDGGQGNDSLNGGAGADTLIGGLGNDSYTVDNSGDVVLEYAGEGTDTVSSSISYALGSELENLTLTGSAALSGTGNALNNSLTGNSGANVLTGGAGNDSLNGGAGADTLIGGMGNDSYTIDNLGDQVQEVLDEGIDLVNSGVTFVLGANLENLTLTGTAAINGTGNDLANTLVGNSAANILTGGAGNDILNGGTGIDTLIGGTGDDAYTVDVVGDVVQENSGEGIDTINSAVSWTLGVNVENLSLTGSAAINATGNGADNVLIGNSGANTLTGFAGNDWLDGGAGNDSLVGSLGDDTYVVAQAADVVTEALGEGIDTVRSSVTWTLGANLETLILTGVAAINGTGNAQDNALYGNTANNALNGGAGADTMAGGQGNDTFTVDNAGDMVIEFSGEGVDTVSSSLSWVLGEEIEKLTLTGSALIDGTGNALDNTLTGNTASNTLAGLAGNDWLDGGSGNDTMLGGAGDDTYVVAQAGDVVVEGIAEGTDTVRSAVTYTLGANLENLVLTGSNINGTGNELDNVLTGSAGNNTLSGIDGADTLDGLAGTDLLIGGSGDDTYRFGSGYGSDTVRDIDSTLANMDRVDFLSGIAADQLWLRQTGNNLEFSIIGTSDKLMLENWYGGSENHVEEFHLADGRILTDSRVELLVQAMAAFAPLAAGQTTLPPVYQESLAPVIAANWQ